jgi:hypothetical protein
MQGFQPTRAWPGQSEWPNGQCCGLRENNGTVMTINHAIITVEEDSSKVITN